MLPAVALASRAVTCPRLCAYPPQVLYMLADEMDARGGELAVVLSGYEKALYDTVLSFNNGALSNRFRRTRRWVRTHTLCGPAL